MSSCSPLTYPARRHALKVFEKLIQQNPNHYPHPDRLPIIYLEASRLKCRDDTDRELPFHQEANFMYLTGAHDIKDASVLVSISHLDKHQTTIEQESISTVLFIPTVDPLDVMWCGLPETPQQVKNRLPDLSSVKYKNEFVECLKSIISQRPQDTHPNPVEILTLPSTTVDPRIASSPDHKISSDSRLLNAIHEARTIKTEPEIQLIREANRISSIAHTSIMQRLSHKSIRSESDAENFFRSECHRHGSKTQAYEPIFGYGIHAGTLHYTSNDAEFPADFSGVLLMDAGCEKYGYASDITRTLPIGNRGRFTPEAKAIYEIVLEMQEAALENIKPGIEWEVIQVLMHKVAAKGLLKLGILQEVTVDECYQDGHVIPFFPHGVGHFLGLDTHDVAGLPHGKGKHPTLKYLRLQRKLEVGNVVTVEPGLYFNQFLLDPVKGSKFINHQVLLNYLKVGGVRIEDNVVVTEHGCQNLTDVVKTVGDIEKLTSH